MAVLSGIHPVMEALRAGRPLERVLVAQGAGGPRVQAVIDLARQAEVPVRFEPRAALDRLAGTAAHQGIVALGAAKKYGDLDSVAAPRAGLLVVLDGVEDPHNLGAVIRTAHAAGAAGVVIPERRAASITDVVAKAAAGIIKGETLRSKTNFTCRYIPGRRMSSELDTSTSVSSVRVFGSSALAVRVTLPGYCF